MTTKDIKRVAEGLTEPDVSGIQRRMAQARAARKMTLQEVANASGITKSHVWELEQGRSRNPTIRAVWAIASALCVSPAWLLGLDPKAPPVDPLALEVAALINERLAVRAHLQGEGT